MNLKKFQFLIPRADPDSSFFFMIFFSVPLFHFINVEKPCRSISWKVRLMLPCREGSTRVF